MDVKVNKGTSHPIEIISCGTSSCITIEEAEQTIGQLGAAISAVRHHRRSEFEAAVEEMAEDVMGYNFVSEAGLRNCAAQLLFVARKQLAKELPVWKKISDVRTGLYKTPTLDMSLRNGGYCLSLEELWSKLPKEE